MELRQLLEGQKNGIIDQAVEAIRRAHLEHYTSGDPEQTRRRLELLFDLTVQSATSKNVTAMVRFAEELAARRFQDGFDLYEVQSAFNVLEEAIWKTILANLPPSDLAQALGLVSTVLGMGKDALARAYVSLASRGKAPSLDLKRIFHGTDGS